MTAIVVVAALTAAGFAAKSAWKPDGDHLNVGKDTGQTASVGAVARGGSAALYYQKYRPNPNQLPPPRRTSDFVDPYHNHLALKAQRPDIYPTGKFNFRGMAYNNSLSSQLRPLADYEGMSTFRQPYNRR